jgi:pimeloyl-ACP methyl ester carboxylesterase
LEHSSNVNVCFAHANGFPAGSYRKLFGALNDDYQVSAIEKFGHNNRFPISKNWGNQTRELIESIELTHNTPVYAIGHSFGGVVSYMAACMRPDLFKGLIMLDPPMITGLTRVFFRGAKATPLIDKITPAGKTVNRCRQWHKDEDLVDYFQSRALFKNIDSDCIRDYVSSATEVKGQYRQLHFTPEIEANIFRNIPHDIHRYYGKLACPALLVTGEHTQVCIERRIQPFIKANKLTHKVFSGGHMFPLESPIQTAELINQTIEGWRKGTSTSKLL